MFHKWVMAEDQTNKNNVNKLNDTRFKMRDKSNKLKT